MFVQTNSFKVAVEFKQQFLDHKYFMVLDSVYLMANHSVGATKANAMPSCVAMVHIVCFTTARTNFVFKPVRGRIYQLVFLDLV